MEEEEDDNDNEEEKDDNNDNEEEEDNNNDNNNNNNNNDNNNEKLTLNDKGDNVAVAGSLRVGGMARIETWKLKFCIIKFIIEIEIFGVETCKGNFVFFLL